MAVPGAETSDEALAARAAAGDEPAFEDLVIRYQARVFRLARRLTNDDGDAQDALQEAFLQVYRNLSSFRGDARFSTWLYRIATNAALMQRRARQRRPAESLDAYLPRFDAAGEHATTPEALHAPCRVEEVLDRRLLAEKARAGIERLPDLYREAFVLRDLEELETSEGGRGAGPGDGDGAAARTPRAAHAARLPGRAHGGEAMNADVRCSSGVSLLMDYLEDALPADLRRDLETHVSGCPRCTAFVASYRETPRIVRVASAVTVPPDLEASLLRFLRARRSH